MDRAIMAMQKQARLHDYRPVKIRHFTKMYVQSGCCGTQADGEDDPSCFMRCLYAPHRKNKGKVRYQPK
jgi:hypothetical protein